MLRRLSLSFYLACLILLTLTGALAHAQDASPGAARNAGDPSSLQIDTPAADEQAADEDEQASDGDALPVALDSPRATVVETFLPAMQRLRDGRGDPERAWAVVRQTLNTSTVEPQQVEAAAWALEEILRKVSLPEDGLPYETMVSDRTRYVLFPQPDVHGEVWQTLADRGATRYTRSEVVLAADDAGRWRFTAETVANAPDLAATLAPLPPTQLEGVEDPSSTDFTDVALGLLGPTFSETPAWAWGALFGCIFLGLVAGRIAKTLCRRAADRLRRGQRAVRATIFDDLASPFSLALLTLGIGIGLFGFIRMDDPVQAFAIDVLAFLYLFALGWFLFNLVDVVEVALRRLTARTQGKLDDTLVPLLRKTLRIFLVIVFTLVIAQNIFGLNITGWLAGLGIAGLAVSLAAQDSVKNLFGSLMIYFDKPFTIGDWIIFDGYEGYVEEIGFRSTRLRLWSRHQVTIPNMKFNDGMVTNVARRPLDRRIMSIAITYDTPPDKIEEAVRIINEILREPEVAAPFDFDQYPPQVAFDEFNDASLNIQVYYYFMLKDGRGYWDYFQHRQLVNMKIVRRFNEAGIEFAFPTQTLHLAGDPNRELAIKLLESDGQLTAAPTGDRSQ